MKEVMDRKHKEDTSAIERYVRRKANANRVQRWYHVACLVLAESILTRLIKMQKPVLIRVPFLMLGSE